MSSVADLVERIDIARLSKGVGIDSSLGEFVADIHFVSSEYSGTSPLRLSQGEIIALVEQMAEQAIRNHMEELQRALKE